MVVDKVNPMEWFERFSWFIWVMIMMAKILVQNDDDPKKWFKRIFTLRVPQGEGSLVLWEDGLVSAFLRPSSFPIS